LHAQQVVAAARIAARDGFVDEFGHIQTDRGGVRDVHVAHGVPAAAVLAVPNLPRAARQADALGYDGANGHRVSVVGPDHQLEPALRLLGSGVRVDPEIVRHVVAFAAGGHAVRPRRRNRGQRRQGAGRRVGAVELTVVPAQHDGRIRRGTNLRVDADTRRAHDEAGRIAVVPQRTDALASRCVVVPYVVLDHVLVAERDGVVAATHLRTVGARHVADDDAAVFADRRDTGNAEVIGRPRSGTASDHLDLHVEDAGGVRVFAGVRGVFPRGGHDRVGEHDGVIAGPWNLPKRRRQAGVFGGAGE